MNNSNEEPQRLDNRELALMLEGEHNHGASGDASIDASIDASGDAEGKSGGCCCEGCPKTVTTPQAVAAIMPDWKRVFVSREEFLKMLSFALAGIIGVFAAVPPLAFGLNYFFVQTQRKWVGLGAVDKYKEGQTVDVSFEEPFALPWDGVTGKRAVWLRRNSGQEFLAFSVSCTHLGCPVLWEAGPELFMCPCHGGVYYSNGDVAGGPPPKALHRYPVRVKNDQVEISVGPMLAEG